jgi:hypothetical protein
VEGEEEENSGVDLETEPLFCGSNLMEVDEEEPLFVLELAAGESAAIRYFHFHFPNGNGACGADGVDAMASSITEVIL